MHGRYFHYDENIQLKQVNLWTRREEAQTTKNKEGRPLHLKVKLKILNSLRPLQTASAGLFQAEPAEGALDNLRVHPITAQFFHSQMLFLTRNLYLMSVIFPATLIYAHFWSCFRWLQWIYSVSGNT